LRFWQSGIFRFVSGVSIFKESVMKKSFLFIALAFVLTVIPASLAATPDTGAATAKEANNAYLQAINSNDLETLMGMLTEDTVFQVPNSPELIGKNTVRAWIKGYFGAYKTVWDFKVLELIQSGNWAIERYTYRVTNTLKSDNSVFEDIGKGIIIYRKEKDGRWRVARDSWSSDLPIK
jgi:ketosteroid isomerase-like protein